MLSVLKNLEVFVHLTLTGVLVKAVQKIGDGH